MFWPRGSLSPLLSPAFPTTVETVPGTATGSGAAEPPGLSWPLHPITASFAPSLPAGVVQLLHGLLFVVRLPAVGPALSPTCLLFPRSHAIIYILESLILYLFVASRPSARCQCHKDSSLFLF